MVMCMKKFDADFFWTNVQGSELSHFPASAHIQYSNFYEELKKCVPI